MTTDYYGRRHRTDTDTAPTPTTTKTMLTTTTTTTTITTTTTRQMMMMRTTTHRVLFLRFAPGYERCLHIAAFSSRCQRHHVTAAPNHATTVAKLNVILRFLTFSYISLCYLTFSSYFLTLMFSYALLRFLRFIYLFIFLFFSPISTFILSRINL